MIKEAAIKTKNEKIHTGRRHCDIIKFAQDFNWPKDYFKNSTQGFIDFNGKFYDRKKAAEIAFECGQIKEKKDILFSEDLY
jgi:hypothetical protein